MEQAIIGMEKAEAGRAQITAAGSASNGSGVQPEVLAAKPLSDAHRKLLLVVENLSKAGTHKAGRGRAWSDEEDAALLEFVKAEPLGNLSAALEEAARILQRTPVAVRARYYRLCTDRPETAKVLEEAEGVSGKSKKPGQKTKALAARGAAAPRKLAAAKKRCDDVVGKGGDTLEDPLLESMAGFLGTVSRLDVDLEGLFRGLWKISELALQGKEAADLKLRIAKLEEENADLREKVGAASKKLEELRSQYEVLDYLVDEFMNLNSVDKVTSLGDFGRRLKYQVDQFGTVVKVERF